MFRLVLADWRRLTWLYLLAAPIWALILFLIYRDFVQYRGPWGDFRELTATKLLFMILIYGQGAMVGWAQWAMYGDYSRRKLTETLPLSLYQLPGLLQ